MIHFDQVSSMPANQKNLEPLVVPPSIQKRAGLSREDTFEFHARRGIITITAKTRRAGQEYSPQLRRAIDARLSAAKKTATHGPFEIAEAVRFLKTELKARRKTTSKTG